jgi:hypothetical protein
MDKGSKAREGKSLGKKGMNKGSKKREGKNL